MTKQSNFKTEETVVAELKEELKEISFRVEKGTDKEIEERMDEMKEMIRKLSEGDGKQEMTAMCMLHVGIIAIGCMALGLALFRRH